MKKQSFGKILSFLPALAMLAAIFSFSAQTGTQSGGLSQTASQWLVAHWRALTGGDCSPDAIALQAKAIEFWVRKGAHMTEYALLCLSVSLPFGVYRIRPKLRIPLTPLICAAVAAGDEFHQSFVAGRGPSVRDVGIDTLGALCALGLLELICHLIRQHKRKRQTN